MPYLTNVFFDLQIVEPAPPEYKTFFQCLCCKNKNVLSQVDFDTIEDLRAHLAVHHFKNFLVNEIKTGIKQFPYCPFQNCDFLARDMKIVMEHFNLDHKPEVFDSSKVDDILSRKCSKCFFGKYFKDGHFGLKILFPLFTN